MCLAYCDQVGSVGVVGRVGWVGSVGSVGVGVSPGVVVGLAVVPAVVVAPEVVVGLCVVTGWVVADSVVADCVVVEFVAAVVSAGFRVVCPERFGAAMAGPAPRTTEVTTGMATAVPARIPRKTSRRSGATAASGSVVADSSFMDVSSSCSLKPGLTPRAYPHGRSLDGPEDVATL